MRTQEEWEAQHRPWAMKVVQALGVAGVEHDAAIEPSNVSGSPYPYVYVYATDAREEGRHAIISQAAESEDSSSVWVGIYNAYWDDDVHVVEFPTVAEAVAYVKEKI